MRRYNLAIVAIILYWFASLSIARAGELTIFDVRRPVALSQSEVTLKDFYINGGTEAGLAPGMIINVNRKIPLYDSYQNRNAGDLVIKVARLKIVSAQRGIAVARLHSEFSRDNNPILEDNYIMVGDQLDIASATSEKNASAESHSAPKETPTSAADELPTTTSEHTRPVATILVNSTEISSESTKPDAIQAPILQ